MALLDSMHVDSLEQPARPVYLPCQENISLRTIYLKYTEKLLRVENVAESETNPDNGEK